MLGFGDQSYELLYEVPGTGTVTITLEAGDEFDFELGELASVPGVPFGPAVPGGVSSFRVLGIEVPARARVQPMTRPSRRSFRLSRKEK